MATRQFTSYTVEVDHALSACSQPQNSRTRNNRSSAGWAGPPRNNTWGEPSVRSLGSGVRLGARIGIVKLAWVLLFLCYPFRVPSTPIPTHPSASTSALPQLYIPLHNRAIFRPSGLISASCGASQLAASHCAAARRGFLASDLLACGCR